MAEYYENRALHRLSALQDELRHLENLIDTHKERESFHDRGFDNRDSRRFGREVGGRGGGGSFRNRESNRSHPYGQRDDFGSRNQSQYSWRGDSARSGGSSFNRGSDAYTGSRYNDSLGALRNRSSLLDSYGGSQRGLGGSGYGRSNLDNLEDSLYGSGSSDRFGGRGDRSSRSFSSGLGNSSFSSSRQSSRSFDSRSRLSDDRSSGRGGRRGSSSTYRFSSSDRKFSRDDNRRRDSRDSFRQRSPPTRLHQSRNRIINDTSRDRRTGDRRISSRDSRSSSFSSRGRSSYSSRGSSSFSRPTRGYTRGRGSYDNRSSNYRSSRYIRGRYARPRGGGYYNNRYNGRGGYYRGRGGYYGGRRNYYRTYPSSRHYSSSRYRREEEEEDVAASFMERRIKHVMDHTPYSLVKRTHTKKPMMVKMTVRQKALAAARHRVLIRQKAQMEIVQKNKEDDKKELAKDDKDSKDGKDKDGKAKSGRPLRGGSMVKLRGVRYRLVVSRFSKSLNRIQPKKKSDEESAATGEASEAENKEKAEVVTEGDKPDEEKADDTEKDGAKEDSEEAKTTDDATKDADETTEAEKSADKADDEKPEDESAESSTPELKAQIEPKISSSQMTASRLRLRSIHTSIAAKYKKENKGAEAKRYCMFYNRFGRCTRGDKCNFIHDAEKIAVCTRFLRGTCKSDDCPFSHKVSKDKMPVCSYFMRGVCNRDNCPYSHVKVSNRADICRDFLRGYCPYGSECKRRHTVECSEFNDTGVCPRGNNCPLRHYKRRPEVLERRNNRRRSSDGKDEDKDRERSRRDSGRGDRSRDGSRSRRSSGRGGSLEKGDGKGERGDRAARTGEKRRHSGERGDRERDSKVRRSSSSSRPGSRQDSNRPSSRSSRPGSSGQRSSSSRRPSDRSRSGSDKEKPRQRDTDKKSGEKKDEEEPSAQEEEMDSEYVEDLGDEDGIPPSFIALDTITESDDDQDNKETHGEQDDIQIRPNFEEDEPAADGEEQKPSEEETAAPPPDPAHDQKEGTPTEDENTDPPQDA